MAELHEIDAFRKDVEPGTRRRCTLSNTTAPGGPGKGPHYEFFGVVDTAHDGEVFDVVVANIPERKIDLVAGTYERQLLEGGSAPVAVKIADMLGEKVLVVLARG